MAISAVGEGCHKQMQPMLQEILDGILNFLQDPVCNLLIYLKTQSIFLKYIFVCLASKSTLCNV